MLFSWGERQPRYWRGKDNDVTSENAFSDNNWPQPTSYVIRKGDFRYNISDNISDSPDSLKTGSILMNLGPSKTVIEKSFETSSPPLQTHYSSCTDSTHIGLAAATTATAAAGARGQSACDVIALPSPVAWLPFTPRKQHRAGSMTGALQSICACSVFSNTRYMLYRLSVLPNLVETGTY